MDKIIGEDINAIIGNDLSWGKLKNSTFLISGATGFIPSYLVKTLLALDKNIRIIGIIRDKDKAKKIFLPNKNLKLIIQDISIPLLIKERIDYIIHAASPASPKYYSLDPVNTLKSNILGSFHLLELAKQKQVKGYLFFSSGEIYGEIDPINVRACYAEGKRAGESLAIAYSTEFNIPIKIVRLFHTYGPGMTLGDGRVFSDFVADIVNSRNIVMKSEGKVKRCFCYISDMIAGIFTVLLKGQAGSVYNLGNNRAEISVKDLANLLVNLFPQKKLRVIREKREKTERYIETNILNNRPDTSKIRSLGWKAKYGLGKGFRRTINSFLENG